MNRLFNKWQQQTKTEHLKAELQLIYNSFSSTQQRVQAINDIEQGILLLEQVAKEEGEVDNAPYVPDVAAYSYAQLKVKDRMIEDRLYNIRTMRNFTMQLMDYFSEEGDARVRRGFDLIMKGIKQLEDSLFIYYEAKRG